MAAKNKNKAQEKSQPPPQQQQAAKSQKKVTNFVQTCTLSSFQ